MSTHRYSAGGGTVDRGSATIWVLLCVSIVLIVAVMGAAVGSVISARQRAQSAADLAALGGAAALIAGTVEPCGRARPIAVANTATVTSCQISGDNLLIRTAASLPAPLARLGLGPAQASARAGPDRG